MKRITITCLAAAILPLAACKDTAEKTTDTVSNTAASVVHKTDPFATDTTTTTTQKYLQPPPTSSNDIHNPN